jgi:hypothetical protein
LLENAFTSLWINSDFEQEKLVLCLSVHNQLFATYAGNPFFTL